MRPGRYPDNHPLEIKSRQQQHLRALREVEERQAKEQQAPAPQPVKAKPARSRW